MAVVAERYVDSGMLHIIQMWLKAPVMEEEDRRDSGRTSAAARQTPKAHRRAASSRRYWPTSICTCWTGCGRENTFSADWKPDWCDMRIGLSYYGRKGHRAADGGDPPGIRAIGTCAQ